MCIQDDATFYPSFPKLGQQWAQRCNYVPGLVTMPANIPCSVSLHSPVFFSRAAPQPGLRSTSDTAGGW